MIKIQMYGLQLRFFLNYSIFEFRVPLTRIKNRHMTTLCNSGLFRYRVQIPTSSTLEQISQEKNFVGTKI